MTIVLIGFFWLGSPPHTWRIQIPTSSANSVTRITSTYVENTGSSSAYVRLYEDHLHIRGEYRLIWQSVMLRIGSPPHTWRIRYFQASLWRSFRITSTYVENTIFPSVTMAVFQDHLHIRGEYRDLNRNKDFRAGSPPHTWRILVLQEQSYTRLRITSTYVENTPDFSAIFPSWVDHLHIRGEYSTYCRHRQMEKGSPPHTWRIQWKWSQTLEF